MQELQAPTEQEQLPDELFTFSKAKINIDLIIGEFSTDISEARQRRKERYVDLDVRQLRGDGSIGPDETFIPDRVINTNIGRDKGDIVSFLNVGYRIGIFDCVSNPTIDTRRLEHEFTKGLTYKGWYREFDRTIDGALLHGRDFIEVMFDATKPLHVGFEHVGFDKLFFNRKADSPQDSEWCIREYEITLNKLEEFRDGYGFDPIQVSTILNTRQNARRNDIIKLFKCYFKYKNCVYIAWYCRETGVNEWIKPPEKLKMGVQDKLTDTDPITLQPTESLIDIEIDQYPIFGYIYKEDEQRCIVDKKGIGYLDSPQQEANTAIITSFVNGVIKSANIYACPKVDDGESTEMKELDIQLIPGGVYNKPIDFFHMPAPDVSMLQSISFLDSKNASQAGKLAAAVSNRKDSRKTAEELKQAQGQEEKIISANLETFAEFLWSVLDFSWVIVRSQSLQNKIKLLLIEQPDQMGQIQYINDLPTIGEEYDVRPAGSQDVIENGVIIQQMQQDWPVIQTTPLASQFLQDFIKLRYPKKSDEYINILISGDPGKKIASSLLTLVQGLANSEEMKQLPPQEAQNIQMIEQQAQMYLQPTQQAK